MYEWFAKHEAEEHFEEHEMVVRLIKMREDLRDRYKIGRTLQEQLDEAIAKEQYELAAMLRDQLSDEDGGKR